MFKRQVENWIDGWMIYQRNSEPPDTYKKWTAISLIASALRRKCVLRWGTLDFYPNMYIVLVGPSGKCKKGTAMTPGLKMLSKLGIKLAAESTTREALCRDLKNSTESKVDLDGLAEVHSSLTIYSQELTVFLGYGNLQLMSDLTDWYDCRDRWTYRTKHQGTDEIEGVWVNLIGATTPALIQSTLPMDAIGGGLTSRMIFVYEEKKGKTVVLPFLDEEEKMMEEKLLEDLRIISNLRGEFKVTDSFIDKWVVWYPYQEKHPPFDDTRLAPYLERRGNHVLKLSMIVSAAKRNDMLITHEDLEDAINLLMEVEKKMPNTFAGLGRGKSADVTNLIMVEIATRGECMFSDLLNMFYHDVDDRNHLLRIIGTLEHMRFITVEHISKDLIIRHIKKESK